MSCTISIESSYVNELSPFRIKVCLGKQLNKTLSISYYVSLIKSSFLTYFVELI